MVCVFAGSFNPIHEGHKYVIDCALKDGFDKVIVLIAQNEDKQPANLNEIKINVDKYLNEYIKTKKVEIDINYGLTAKYLKDHNITWLVRGYRNFKDLWYEKKLYKKYLKVNADIKLKLYKSPNHLKNVRSSNITSYD